MKSFSHRLFYILFAFLLRGGNFAFAQTQPMTFERFSVEEGLPQASGYSLAQDLDGYIWMGTQDGLCRYDGYQFKVYRMQTDSGLRGNTMNDILCDHQGRLWAGTPDGVSFKERHDNHFVPFEPLKNNNIHYFFEDKNHYLWVLTFDEGLFRITPDRKTVKNYFRNNDLKTSIIDITQTPEGHIWVAARTTLLKYNAENDDFSRLPLQQVVGKTDREMTLRAIESDAEGKLWLGGFDNGVFVVDPKQFSTPSVNKPKILLKSYQSEKNNRYHSLAGNSISEIFLAKNGDMWIGTKDGLTIFRRAENRFDTYQHRDDSPLSISRNYVISLLEDRQGLFWIGTSGGGVVKYDPAHHHFEHLRQLHTEDNPKVDNLTYGIQKMADGTLYFGVQSNGLVQLKNGQYKVFRSDDNTPTALLNNTIYMIEKGNNDRDLWLATLSGLAKFDTKTEKMTAFEISKDASQTKVSAICKLRGQNILLVSSLKGLLKLDLTTEKWVDWKTGTGQLVVKNLNQNEQQTTQNLKFTEGVLWLKDISVRRIFEDAEGIVWLGTESKGLIRLDVKNQTLQQIIGLPSSTVRAIIDAAKGQLWIGTDQGLVLFDKENFKVLKHFKVSDGLPNELIYSLLTDEDNNLWIATNKGLARLSADQKSFRLFDVQDGLQSNEFNTNGAFKADDGRLFFGGVNGVTAFYNQNFTTNTYNAPVKITGFKVFDADFSFSENRLLELNYQQNFFSFEFAALNYSIPTKNKYAYQLEGVDRDWVYSGHRHSASYTDVKAGHYVFKVRGTNNDGLWSTETATIRLYIRPAFWQTAWFKLLLAAICIGGSYVLLNFYFKTRYRLQLAQLEKEREKERLRTSIAQDIHDDIGAGLTKISLGAAFIERLPDLNAVDFREKAGRLGQEARHLARKLKEIVFAINPDFDNFTEMQAYFRAYAADFWAESNINVHFNFEKRTKTPPSVSPLIKRHLLHIFTEAQNNTAKYGEAKSLYLTLKLTANDHYLLEIRDDGHGFDPLSKNGFTKGISGMQQRAERIGANFSIKSEIGKGTTVRVEGNLNNTTIQP